MPANVTTPGAIAVLEAENVAPMTAVVAAWGDGFEVTVIPAVTVEEGLKLVQQMMQGQSPAWPLTGNPLQKGPGKGEVFRRRDFGQQTL